MLALPFNSADVRAHQHANLILQIFFTSLSVGLLVRENFLR